MLIVIDHEKQKQIAEKVKALFLEVAVIFNLNAKTVAEIFSDKSEKSFELKIPQANEIVFQFLLKAGIHIKYAKAIVYGINPIHADGELSCYNEGWNWCNLKDWYKFHYAIQWISQTMAGDMRCEVGMKYPNFRKDVLIKKYGLTQVNDIEPTWSKRNDDPKRKTFYEIWVNKTNDVIFSFEKGRMGDGGYAGAIFPTMERAIHFAEWYLNHKSYYIKDMDLIHNGLGGIGIREWDRREENVVIELEK